MPNIEGALISSSDKTERSESIAISEQDRLLINACIEDEEPVFTNKSPGNSGKGWMDPFLK